jgi:hypothetical protein
MSNVASWAFANGIFLADCTETRRASSFAPNVSPDRGGTPLATRASGWIRVRPARLSPRMGATESWSAAVRVRTECSVAPLGNAVKDFICGKLGVFVGGRM